MNKSHMKSLTMLPLGMAAWCHVCEAGRGVATQNEVTPGQQAAADASSGVSSRTTSSTATTSAGAGMTAT